MKKKCMKAIALALVLAAVPAMAYGASGSPQYEGSGDSSGSTGGSSSIGGNGTSGTSVTQPSSPSIEVSSDGQQISVGQKSEDASGTSMGLVVNTTTSTGQSVTMGENGAAVVGDMEVTIAVGEAETAGLPEGTVGIIDRLNRGEAASSVFPQENLGGYQKLGKTRALVLTSQTTGRTDASSTEISLVVDDLKRETQEVVVMYYDNQTGRWYRVNAVYNTATKQVTFVAPGSCTIQILWR